MRTLTSAMIAFFALSLFGGLAAYAENACTTCQNDCFAQLEACKKKHSEEFCMNEYGTCKMGCKGSPACLEKCKPVKGHAQKGQMWHGVTCYSSQGCHCSALKCAKAPHYRDAKCSSPPG
jgi:hypothetical protein